MACDSPYYVKAKRWHENEEKVPVPCGRCPPCKLRRVNGWVFRLLQEDKRSDTSHFVTLTYDTKFVPISENGFMTLRKSDFQKYMKRLRKLCPGADLKYYAVGEYGTNRHRPHYHAIIFGVPDIELFAEAWKLDGNSLGAVHVGTVSGESIAYTLKYIDKQSGKLLYGSRDDREPEFPLMSKRLGNNYITQATVDYHRSDLSRMYLTRPGGNRIAMPRYYRGKIFTDDDLAAQIPIIEKAMIIDEQRERVEYSRIYSGDDAPISFEAWQTSRRHGRYEQFYINQKSREI